VRTFIACELAPAVRQPLVKLLRHELPAGREVKWVTEAQLHVTLKFLGELRDTQLKPVCEVIADVSRAVPPFSIRVCGLGCFPGPRNPRVLWAGVEDPTRSCQRWVTLAEPRFTDLGFPPEGRAFTPHLTLGRARSTAGGDVLREALENVRPPATEATLVTQVILFESRLAPRGAEYHHLATLPLGE
jgi:RNA 2',3'-cyclic 3'-phosphodiesterase